MRPAWVVALTVTTFVTAAMAKDWPTYRGNAARNGYTSDSLPDNLVVAWQHPSPHPPQPAWPTSDRLTFDRAYQPVVANGTLYYGSSADGKVYALDAATGAVKWTFYTDAPVRFAPITWKDRVIVGSDDGHLYCLSAADGAVLWKRRGGPTGRRLLGNDRMISAWPVRGGPVILDGVLYFTAGIWPSDGIYIYALDADTGKMLWVNDQAGYMEMDQPHGGARARSGVSGQGYLAALGNQLFLPTGRAVPAVFNRADGAFQYFHLQRHGHNGGAELAVIGDHFFNSGFAFDTKTGKTRINAAGNVYAAAGDTIVLAGPNKISGHRWEMVEKKDRKGRTFRTSELKEHWSASDVPAGVCLIVAGNRAVTADKTHVAVVDLETRRVLWKQPTTGTAYGLAVADGRLYVSTDRGVLTCYAAKGAAPSAPPRRETVESPYGENAAFASAAQAIIEKTGITEGYCLDLGCGDGALAYELAKRTRLQIYALDADPHNVAEARKRLDSAGLYGVRVTVHESDPALTPYPRFFANLIVSGRSVTEGPGAVATNELARLGRPYGGIACFGKADNLEITTRPALQGAGQWTHQYSNAANTCSSTDQLVKGPLTMLWFRDADLEMPQRHGRGPAPLFHAGRLLVEGKHALRAIDAYNGKTLWEHPIKNIRAAYNADHLVGTAATGSNVCVADKGVYVAVKDHCLRLDPATGKKIGEFPAPGHPDGNETIWGYIACENGTLFGTLANTAHIVRWAYLKADMSQLFTESDLLFAMDPESGKVKWTFDPDHSIRHNAVAGGGGKVFLIDRPIAEKDKIDYAQRRKGKEAGKAAPKPPAEHPTGRLVALDAETGETLWENEENIYGTTLSLSVEHKLLLMSYQPTRFKLPSETGGKMAAFQTDDGELMWDYKMNYITRPLINGRTIYAQGGAWDMATGQQQAFNFKRSYGCGQLAGSTNMLLFRSATLGYLDLTSETGRADYGGVRPGCWINAIPAGGIVLMPDASAGCRCSYLNRASLALQSAR